MKKLVSLLVVLGFSVETVSLASNRLEYGSEIKKGMGNQDAYPPLCWICKDEDGVPRSCYLV